MACRDIDKAKTAMSEIEARTETIQGKGTLIVEKIDLCSFQSIKDFAEKVLASEKSVNILVNNAGVMMCPQGKTEEGFETHIGSNHFGHALLTLLLLPVMAKSTPSRIINVSSYLHKRKSCPIIILPSDYVKKIQISSNCPYVDEVHKLYSFAGSDLPLDDINFERSPYDAYTAYCRSKAANVLFAKALARKLKVRPRRATFCILLRRCSLYQSQLRTEHLKVITE